MAGEGVTNGGGDVTKWGMKRSEHKQNGKRDMMETGIGRVRNNTDELEGGLEC